MTRGFLFDCKGQSLFAGICETLFAEHQANLDHEVGRGSIANILRDHGLEPAPKRLKKTTWTEFLKTHCDVLAAADFFTVDVWTGRGLTVDLPCSSSSSYRHAGSRSPASRRSPTPPG
jgi:hypothetical protein